MPEKEYVEGSVQLAFTNTIDLDGFYRALVRWCKQNGYSYREIEYKELKDQHELFIRWGASKTVDDYIKYQIDMVFDARNLSNMTVEGKQMIKADINFEAHGAIQKDYDDVWGSKPLRRFFRECYDSLFLGKKMSQHAETVTRDIQSLSQEMKQCIESRKVEAPPQ